MEFSSAKLSIEKFENYSSNSDVAFVSRSSAESELFKQGTTT